MLQEDYTVQVVRDPRGDGEPGGARGLLRQPHREVRQVRGVHHAQELRGSRLHAALGEEACREEEAFPGDIQHQLHLLILRQVKLQLW